MSGSFCTYFTWYYGDKLPPFYIGSKDVEGVLNGYHGSVSSKEYKLIWQSELKANPHLFHTDIMGRFDTRAEALKAEEIIQRRYNVVKSDLYINKAYANGNFACTGHSETTRRKMSASSKGTRGYSHSKATRSKISKSKKGQKASEETKQKLREARKTAVFTEESRARQRMHRLGKKASEETRDKTRGSNNPAAIHVQVYDQVGNLKFDCHGNFIQTMKSNKMPYQRFLKSYQNNSERIIITLGKNKGKYDGWYAVKLVN